MNSDQKTNGSRPAPDQTLVSVVVPVYNEQDVLEALVARLAEALGSTPSAWEVVFVNDGSRDASGRVLDWIAARDPRVRVVHLSRNFGHQAAVQAGLVECRGDAVVLMDADLQDAPEALPRLLAAWRRGADVVYAVRTDRKEHRLKRWAFAAFYRLLAAVSPTPIPLDAGNFGLVDRRVLDVILALGERDRFFPGLRSWVGFRQVGIPVERLARYDDRPRVSLWGLLRLAKTAVFSFSTLPLSVFYGIGLAALGIFVLVGGYAIACRLFTELAIPGWTSHVLVGCFFGALNALGVSILGEYVVRIYDQVRGRPLYVVERRVGQVDTSLAGDSWSTIEESDAHAGELLVAVSVLREEVARVTREAPVANSVENAERALVDDCPTSASRPVRIR